MKVKTIFGEKFKINTKDIKTVKQLKQKLLDYDPKFEINKQTICYSGAVLQDNKLLDYYGIDDSSLVVLLVKELYDEENIKKQSNESEYDSEDMPPLIDVQSVTNNNITILTEMGFSYDQVKDALDTTNNDITIAMDYLLSKQNDSDGSNTIEN